MKRLLIVEDEKDIGEMLAGEISSFGFSVDVALSAEEGLENIRNHKYAIVLTDIRLPGMDGVQMMETVHKEFQDPPVFYVMSGFSDYASEEVLQKGAKGIFEKPLGIFNLLDAIRIEGENLKDVG